MGDSQVSVTIEGMGLKYEGNVSLRHALEMLRVSTLPAELLDKPGRPAEAPADRKASSTIGSLGELSLAEVLDEAKPTTSPETIAVIACWVMDTGGQDSVTRQDVSSRYQDARLPLPGNFARDFASAVAKGFIAPSRSDKNLFYVTRKGRGLLRKDDE